VSQPENLPPVPPTPNKILIVPTPERVLKDDPEHPPYLMLHCVSMVSSCMQELLLAAWDHVQRVSPKQHIKREEAHSVTPAYHWGVWEKSRSIPIITRES